MKRKNLKEKKQMKSKKWYAISEKDKAELKKSGVSDKKILRLETERPGQETNEVSDNEIRDLEIELLQLEDRATSYGCPKPNYNVGMELVLSIGNFAVFKNTDGILYQIGINPEIEELVLKKIKVVI